MRRPFGTASVRVLFWKWARREPEDSTEESGADHPDTESEEFAGSFYVFEAWKERCKGIARCELGVFFEKC